MEKHRRDRRLTAHHKPRKEVGPFRINGITKQGFAMGHAARRKQDQAAAVFNMVQGVFAGLHVFLNRVVFVVKSHWQHAVVNIGHFSQKGAGHDLEIRAHAAHNFAEHHAIHQAVRVVSDNNQRAGFWDFCERLITYIGVNAHPRHGLLPEVPRQGWLILVLFCEFQNLDSPCEVLDPPDNEMSLW